MFFAWLWCYTCTESGHARLYLVLFMKILCLIFMLEDILRCLLYLFCSGLSSGKQSKFMQERPCEYFFSLELQERHADAISCIFLQGSSPASSSELRAEYTVNGKHWNIWSQYSSKWCELNHMCSTCQQTQILFSDWKKIIKLICFGNKNCKLYELAAVITLSWVRILSDKISKITFFS